MDGNEVIKVNLIFKVETNDLGIVDKYVEDYISKEEIIYLLKHRNKDIMDVLKKHKEVAKIFKESKVLDYNYTLI